MTNTTDITAKNFRLPTCPECHSERVCGIRDEVDIGVGVQYGPITGYDCLDCGAQFLPPASEPDAPLD